jgi:hypothetical protein
MWPIMWQQKAGAKVALNMFATTPSYFNAINAGFSAT